MVHKRNCLDKGVLKGINCSNSYKNREENIEIVQLGFEKKVVYNFWKWIVWFISWRIWQIMSTKLYRKKLSVFLNCLFFYFCFFGGFILFIFYPYGICKTQISKTHDHLTFKNVLIADSGVKTIVDYQLWSQYFPSQPSEHPLEQTPVTWSQSFAWRQCSLHTSLQFCP